MISYSGWCSVTAGESSGDAVGLLLELRYVQMISSAAFSCCTYCCIISPSFLPLPPPHHTAHLTFLLHPPPATLLWLHCPSLSSSFSPHNPWVVLFLLFFSSLTAVPFVFFLTSNQGTLTHKNYNSENIKFWQINFWKISCCTIKNPTKKKKYRCNHIHS